MATARQVAANRRNAAKAGVRTPEGKAISRLNARKHGIFADALTPEDAEELGRIEDEIIADLRPVGRVEEMLVETLAMTYLRMQRCARAEAEYHVRTWEEPTAESWPYEWERLRDKRSRGERAVTFREKEFERMVELIGLYNARLANQFLRTLHEIERRQRQRATEKAPPVAADLNIQANAKKEGAAASASPGRAQAPDAGTSQHAGGQRDNAQKLDLKKRIQFYGRPLSAISSVRPSHAGIHASGQRPVRRWRGLDSRLRGNDGGT